MQAAGTSCAVRPCPNRCGAATNWLAALAIFGVAGVVLGFAPTGVGTVKPGDVVSYREDLLGRPWRIVHEEEYGRYLIRNGLVCTIADHSEIEPYTGPSKNVSVQLAGECWRDTVLEIRHRQATAIASSRPL